MYSIRKTMPTKMNGTAWFFIFLELKKIGKNLWETGGNGAGVRLSPVSEGYTIG